MSSTKAFVLAFAILSLAAFIGCEQKPAPTPAKSNSHVHDDGTIHTDGDDPEKPGSHVNADGTVHSDDESHSEEDHADHGAPIELGAATAGGFSLRAARDEGALQAGGDAPIDLWITGGTTKVVSVRFWIGTEDARGSMKAKAEIEIPAEPNHWHTHVEVPEPMPAGSKLWVEIEDDQGGRSVASFDLEN